MSASILQLIFSGLFILSACAEKPLYLQDIRNESESYVRLSRRLVNKFVQEIKTQYNLDCVSSGGSMPYDIESLDVGFYGKEGCWSIDKARCMMVAVVEQLIDAINADLSLRPYLREVPIQAERLGLSISLNSPGDSIQEFDKVSFVFTARDKIFYCARDPETEKLVDLHEETYEEAKRIVAVQEANAGKTSLEVL